MIFPEKHSHQFPPPEGEGIPAISEERLQRAAKAIEEHQQALYEQFANYSAADIQKMTTEEYAWRRRANEQYYGYHQENYYPGALARAIKEQERGQESYISAALEARIREWSRTDPRVDWFWGNLTRRIRTGLNDYAAERIIDVLSGLLQQWDQERNTLNTRNLDNIRTLGEAAHDVVSAFDDAKARGDLAYMEAVIEELDSALHDVKYGSE